VDVSVVIPCYRSRATLPELVRRLHAVLPGAAGAYEIILVVDGSPDDTYAVARELERADEHVRAVLLRRNYGQHHASLAGIAAARHGVTVLMDDDLQHPPEEIPTLLAPLSDPLVDVVYGNSMEEEHRFLRNLTSQGVKVVMERMGVPNARIFSSFLAFRTDVREGFLHVAGTAYIDVLLSWSTTGVVSVPIRMDERTSGRSGYTWASLTRLAWDMTAGASTAPLRLVTWLGLVSFVGGVGLFLFIMVSYLTAGPDVPGWTSQAGMTALFSGLIMLSLGIVGEYLGRLHAASMRRPVYLVRVPGRDETSPVSHPGLHEQDGDAIAAALTRRYATGNQTAGK
jgi:glycosyltransferase involved in cell wall biosynthesis